MAMMPNDLFEPFMNPATGSLVDPDSIDSLCSSWEDADKLVKELQRFKDRCRTHLTANLASNGTKTHRVRGSRFEATIVEKDPTPNGTVLRQVVKAFPEQSKDLIVPNGYKIAMREWKKAQATVSDNREYTAVIQMVNEAISSGYQPQPAITKITRL